MFSSFRLNTISAAVSSSVPENSYSTGWYFYENNPSEQLTSYIGTHQLAVMGYNSDYNLRAVAAIQAQTSTANYLLPIRWNYSTNNWTIGTKVATIDSAGDYTGFTGRKAVSEVSRNIGTADATNYGLTYVPFNSIHQVKPFWMDSSGTVTVGTGVDTLSPSIGTSAESGDLAYDGLNGGVPTYVFFTREDAGNNTQMAFTRSGTTITRVAGNNAFGTGNRTTVEGAFVNQGKANLLSFNGSGNTMAGTTIDASGTVYTSSAVTHGLMNKVTVSNVYSSGTTTKYIIVGQNATAPNDWCARVVNVTWNSASAPTITLGATIYIIDSVTNIPDAGYAQNIKVVKGWNDNESFVFYTKSNTVYNRRLFANGDVIGVGSETNLGTITAGAYSLDVQPAYIDANHRYFLGMTNAGNAENTQGAMSLFSVRAQNISDVIYSVNPTASSINEGSALTFNVNTLGVANTTLYWTIDTNAGDFGTSSGSFALTSGAGTFSVTPTADATTEGAETFTVSIRTGSTAGTIVATSPVITINDTSMAPLTLTYQTFASSLTNTIAIPATATTGDFVVLCDYSNTTTDITPAGFTTINNATTTGIRTNISYKKLVAGDAGATLTGLNATSRKVLIVFRPNRTITTITPTVTGSQATTAAPTGQTITGQAGPMIAFATYASTGAVSGRGWVGGTPTEVSSVSTSVIYTKFLITNSGTPASAAISMFDGGTNTLQSFRVAFT